MALINMHLIRGLGSKFGEDCASPFTHYVASFLGSSSFQLLCKLVRNLRLTDERMSYFRCVFQVVADFGGQIPRTADELMKSLPGVGRYTASMFEYIKLMLPPTPLPNPLILLCRCNRIHCIWGAMWGGGWECCEGVLATESCGSMHRSQTDHGTLLVWPSCKTEAVWLVESLTQKKSFKLATYKVRRQDEYF